MSVILQLKGKLVELKQKRTKLSIEAGVHIRDIKEALATAAVKPLGDVDADAVLYHAGLLKEKRDEYMEAGESIGKIEKELGQEPG